MVKGCGNSCIKFILFAFNFIFVTLGLTILGFGIYMVVKSKSINQIISSIPDTAAIFVIIFGFSVFLIAFLGCCGALKESKCMLIVYAIFVLILFVAEISLGVIVIKYRNQVPTEVTKQIDIAFSKYNNSSSDSDKAVKRAFDVMQFNLQCCGKESSKDYKQKVPSSCCYDPLLDGPNDKTCEDPFSNGCIKAVEDVLKYSLQAIGAIEIILALIHLIAVIFACTLANASN